MIAYLSGDLIDSSSQWSPVEIEKFAHELADRFDGRARVTAMALSQGDSFQLETRGQEALAIALLLDALARRSGRPGMRVAFGLQASSDAKLPISVRSGPAYVAAGRGIAELKQRRQRIGYFGAGAAEEGWVQTAMLCGTLSEATTARQNEVLIELLTQREVDQAEIAKRLGISQQAVSKHFRAGRLSSILSAEAAFRAHILQGAAQTSD